MFWGTCFFQCCSYLITLKYTDGLTNWHCTFHLSSEFTLGAQTLLEIPPQRSITGKHLAVARRYPSIKTQQCQPHRELLKAFVVQAGAMMLTCLMAPRIPARKWGRQSPLTGQVYQAEPEPFQGKRNKVWLQQDFAQCSSHTGIQNLLCFSTSTEDTDGACST